MVTFKVTYHERNAVGRGFHLQCDMFDTFEEALEFIKHMAFHFFRFEMVVPVIIEGTDITATHEILLFNNVSIDHNSICLWNCFKMDKE